MKDWLKIIGENVRRIRKERGWDYPELAERARLSRGTVMRIEAGRNSRTENLMQVADTLGIKPADLFATYPEEVDVRYLRDRLAAAEAYINASPCDPDIFPSQREAYQRWQSLLPQVDFNEEGK